jgi:hypothetical protein
VAFRGNFYAHHGCWDSGGISPLFPVACMFENFKGEGMMFQFILYNYRYAKPYPKKS